MGMFSVATSLLPRRCVTVVEDSDGKKTYFSGVGHYIELHPETLPEEAKYGIVRQNLFRVFEDGPQIEGILKFPDSDRLFVFSRKRFAICPLSEVMNENGSRVLCQKNTSCFDESQLFDVCYFGDCLRLVSESMFQVRLFDYVLNGTFHFDHDNQLQRGIKVFVSEHFFKVLERNIYLCSESDDESLSSRSSLSANGNVHAFIRQGNDHLFLTCGNFCQTLSLPVEVSDRNMWSFCEPDMIIYDDHILITFDEYLFVYFYNNTDKKQSLEEWLNNSSQHSTLPFSSICIRISPVLHTPTTTSDRCRNKVSRRLVCVKDMVIVTFNDTLVVCCVVYNSFMDPEMQIVRRVRLSIGNIQSIVVDGDHLLIGGTFGGLCTIAIADVSVHQIERKMFSGMFGSEQIFKYNDGIYALNHRTKSIHISSTRQIAHVREIISINESTGIIVYCSDTVPSTLNCTRIDRDKCTVLVPNFNSSVMWGTLAGSHFILVTKKEEDQHNVCVFNTSTGQLLAKIVVVGLLEPFDSIIGVSRVIREGSRLFIVSLGNQLMWFVVQNCREVHDVIRPRYWLKPIFPGNSNSTVQSMEFEGDGIVFVLLSGATVITYRVTCSKSEEDKFSAELVPVGGRQCPFFNQAHRFERDGQGRLLAIGVDYPDEVKGEEKENKRKLRPFPVTVWDVKANCVSAMVPVLINPCEMRDKRLLYSIIFHEDHLIMFYSRPTGSAECAVIGYIHRRCVERVFCYPLLSYTPSRMVTVSIVEGELYLVAVVGEMVTLLMYTPNDNEWRVVNQHKSSTGYRCPEFSKIVNKHCVLAVSCRDGIELLQIQIGLDELGLPRADIRLISVVQIGQLQLPETDGKWDIEVAIGEDTLSNWNDLSSDPSIRVHFVFFIHQRNGDSGLCFVGVIEFVWCPIAQCIQSSVSDMVRFEQMERLGEVDKEERSVGRRMDDVLVALRCVSIGEFVMSVSSIDKRNRDVNVLECIIDRSSGKIISKYAANTLQRDSFSKYTSICDPESDDSSSLVHYRRHLSASYIIDSIPTISLDDNHLVDIELSHHLVSNACTVHYINIDSKEEIVSSSVFHSSPFHSGTAGTVDVYPISDGSIISYGDFILVHRPCLECLLRKIDKFHEEKRINKDIEVDEVVSCLLTVCCEREEKEKMERQSQSTVIEEGEIGIERIVVEKIEEMVSEVEKLMVRDAEEEEDREKSSERPTSNESTLKKRRARREWGKEEMKKETLEN